MVCSCEIMFQLVNGMHGIFLLSDFVCKENPDAVTLHRL